VHTTYFWPYFGFLLKMFLEIFFLPQVGLPCMVLAVASGTLLVWKRPIRSQHWKRYYWLVLTQWLFVPAMVAVGVLYGYDDDPKPTLKVNPFGVPMIDILFWLSLALGLFWIYRMKGVRWFAFSLIALQQAFLFGALVVANMSITGSWL
jgi:hypothetical protein